MCAASMSLMTKQRVKQHIFQVSKALGVQTLDEKINTNLIPVH